MRITASRYDGTVDDGREFWRSGGCVEGCDMDRRDWELLDKQMRRLQPAPRRDSVMALMLVGVFLAGITSGAYLAAPGNQAPMQAASGDGDTALAFLSSRTTR
jgi:hypothetical protein